jgi:hypothetical protein
MKHVAKDRKSIKYDALIIMNRVTKLKNLEDRMLKKINKTRQDAERIMLNKE